MSEKPTKNGKQRDDRNEKGQFIKGNPGGPGNAQGNISITTRIKQELQKCPEGENKKTYLELLVRRILKKAIVEGDQIMIKSIWAYVDGLPRESIDMTSKGERIGLLDYTQDKKDKEKQNGNRTNDSDKKADENEKEDKGGAGRNKCEQDTQY